MEIKNIDGYSGQQLRDMVAQGGKFVAYKYCISVVIMTFNRPTEIYFVKPGESRIKPGIPFLAINFFLGWWGIPWGPIYTIGNLYKILSGGIDVTPEILGHINQGDPNYGHEAVYNIHTEQASSNTYNIPQS